MVSAGTWFWCVGEADLYDFHLRTEDAQAAKCETGLGGSVMMNVFVYSAVWRVVLFGVGV